MRQIKSDVLATPGSSIRRAAVQGFGTSLG